MVIYMMALYLISGSRGKVFAVFFQVLFAVTLTLNYGGNIFRDHFRSGEKKGNKFWIILDNEDIVMKSAGTQMCSYNYIGDCASAIITVLINGKCGEAYNTANPDVRLTIAQLAEIIASAANRKVVFADPDDVDLAYRTPIAKQVLSSKKLENLGWSGVFSAEIGVKHTLDILLGK